MTGDERGRKHETACDGKRGENGVHLCFERAYLTKLVSQGVLDAALRTANSTWMTIDAVTSHSCESSGAGPEVRSGR